MLSKPFLARIREISIYAKNLQSNIPVQYLTVILRTRVEYELIADEAPSAESAFAHI
jgi:hypothetical protein